MLKPVLGAMAHVGVWVCFCAIGEYVIMFENIGPTMIWGVVAGAVSFWAGEWIAADAKEADQ